jgi:uncharacterized membrane protein
MDGTPPQGKGNLGKKKLIMAIILGLIALGVYISLYYKVAKFGP